MWSALRLGAVISIVPIGGCLALSSCTSQAGPRRHEAATEVVGSAASGGSAAAPNPTNTLAPDGTVPVEPAPANFVPAPGRLRRLTKVQYENSLQDVLGGNIPALTGLEADISLSGFESIGASQISLSAGSVETYESLALASAQAVLRDSAWRTQHVPCSPTGVTDSTCSQAFIRNLGERLWRRPLTEAEVLRWSLIADASGDATKDFWTGLSWGLAGLLQAPQFLYRIELGYPAADQRSVYRLDNFEIASRLSYLLWNTTPDAALLEAAKAGSLAALPGLDSETNRLLASPRAQSGLGQYWFERLRLRALATTGHPSTTFPAFTADVPQAMQEETQALLGDIIFNTNGDIRSFFDSTSVFINDRLADLYGLPAPNSIIPVKAQLPMDSPRIGYLGQGSFLALNAHQETSSPTRRGKFVREVFFCQSMPAPPPNVDVSLDKPSTLGLSTREKLTVHRANPTCAACHALMDPIGLAFENFDAVGAFRTMDAGLPIDPSGELDGARFNNAADLSRLLKTRPETLDCLARSFYRYALGHVEAAGEDPAIALLKSGLERGNYQFLELVRAFTRDQAFTTLAPPVH